MGAVQDRSRAGWEQGRIERKSVGKGKGVDERGWVGGRGGRW